MDPYTLGAICTGAGALGAKLIDYLGKRQQVQLTHEERAWTRVTQLEGVLEEVRRNLDRTQDDLGAARLEIQVLKSENHNLRAGYDRLKGENLRLRLELQRACRRFDRSLPEESPEALGEIPESERLALTGSAPPEMLPEAPQGEASTTREDL